MDDCTVVTRERLDVLAKQIAEYSLHVDLAMHALFTHLRRFVRRSDTESGMVRIELQLPPEQANVLWEAMFAALDAGRRDPARAVARNPPHASPNRRSSLVS